MNKTQPPETTKILEKMPGKPRRRMPWDGMIEKLFRHPLSRVGALILMALGALWVLNSVLLPLISMILNLLFWLLPVMPFLAVAGFAAWLLWRKRNRIRRGFQSNPASTRTTSQDDHLS